MTEKELLKKWMDFAQRDLDAAKVLLQKKKYKLMVAFHLQQAVEKTLKAYIIFKLHNQPPYIHNLDKLARETHLTDEMSLENRELLTILEPFYIVARYPSYKQELEKELSIDSLKLRLNQCEKLKKWLKEKMKL
jgi:HEPN domain-containing protein